MATIDMAAAAVLAGSGKTFDSGNSGADNSIALQWAIDNYAAVTINTAGTYEFAGFKFTKSDTKLLPVSASVVMKLAAASNCPLFYNDPPDLERCGVIGGTWDQNKQNQSQAANIVSGNLKFAISVSRAASAVVTTFAAHGFGNGDTVYFANFVGEHAALNGAHVISGASGSVFTIAVDTSALTTDLDLSDSRIVSKFPNSWWIRTNGADHYVPANDYSYEVAVINRINWFEMRNFALTDSSSPTETPGKTGKRFTFAGCNHLRISDYSQTINVYFGHGTTLNIYGPCSDVVVDGISGEMQDDFGLVATTEWDGEWWYGRGGPVDGVVVRNWVAGTSTYADANGFQILSRADMPCRNITVEHVTGYSKNTVVHCHADPGYGETDANGTIAWNPSHRFIGTWAENLVFRDIKVAVGDRSGSSDGTTARYLFGFNPHVKSSCRVIDCTNLHSGVGAGIWQQDRRAHWDSLEFDNIDVSATSTASMFLASNGYMSDPKIYGKLSFNNITHTWPAAVGRLASLGPECQVGKLELSKITRVNGYCVVYCSPYYPPETHVSKLDSTAFSDSGMDFYLGNAPIYAPWNLTYDGWIIRDNTNNPTGTHYTFWSYYSSGPDVTINRQGVGLVLAGSYATDATYKNSSHSHINVVTEHPAYTTTATLAAPTSASAYYPGPNADAFTVTLGAAADVDYKIALSSDNGLDYFRATPTGNPCSEITISTGQTSGTFYFVPSSTGLRHVSISAWPALAIAGSPVDVTVPDAAFYGGTGASTPSLLVGNNGDGTATATISRSMGGTTNTVYAMRADGSMAGDWVAVGSRVGDGTVVLNLDAGAYWFTCTSSLG
jgi:hypothetical protein